ncbi:nuclear transport factor 2 family protein [Nocardiopsis eucommiae]|uniref:nuclear transport factor 2 family protein n=1 Tax=Nocardiopsis eucommiae TaxID=2831970 RepID=UPI003D714505
MPDSPTTVFHRASEHLLSHDMRAFTALYAEDAVMEFPFAPPGAPRRLEGRETIEAYLAGYTDKLNVLSVHDVTVHQTTVPEVIIAELAVSGRRVPTDAPYTARYVAVLTISGGLIQHYRDYWNPLDLGSDAEAAL